MNSRVVMVVVVVVLAVLNDDDDDFCFPVFCLVVSVVKEYLIVFHSHVCKRFMEFLEKFYKISGQK